MQTHFDTNPAGLVDHVPKSIRNIGTLRLRVCWQAQRPRENACPDARYRPPQSVATFSTATSSRQRTWLGCAGAFANVSGVAPARSSLRIDTVGHPSDASLASLKTRYLVRARGFRLGLDPLPGWVSGTTETDSRAACVGIACPPPGSPWTPSRRNSFRPPLDRAFLGPTDVALFIVRHKSPRLLFPLTALPQDRWPGQESVSRNFPLSSESAHSMASLATVRIQEVCLAPSLDCVISSCSASFVANATYG